MVSGVNGMDVLLRCVSFTVFFVLSVIAVVVFLLILALFVREGRRGFTTVEVFVDIS